MNKDIQMHTCNCGFTWQHGLSGAHMCEPGYRKQIEALEKERDALLVNASEMQAQGVEKFAARAQASMELAESNGDVVTAGFFAGEVVIAKMFAAELRKGSAQ